MVASVCPADSWRILAGLTRGLKLVSAGPACGCCVASHGFEVQPELTDVAGQLAYRGGAGPSGGGGVAAGVARVGDVGVVGGDRGATGGGGDQTAHSEASSTGPAGCAGPAGAV